MRELQHLNIELRGRNLIEASAGTGKTYAIACLYLRLVIESDLTPEQILVVTYTEAATEELRGRIRARLREAGEVFGGAPCADPFLQGLLRKAGEENPGEAAARERLERALTSFDLASIFTIHGFCLRALQDNAFESGSLYDTELVSDQSGLIRELVDDFWRRTFFSADAPLLGYVLANDISPAGLTAFLRDMLGNPQLEILPRISLDQIPLLEERCQELFQAVSNAWRASRTEITELIRNDKGLSKAREAYHPELLPGLFAAMDAYTLRANPFELFPGFGKFCSSGILKGKKPTGAPLSHPFFDLCEELNRTVGQRFLGLKAELLAFAAEQLPALKRERNIRCFDDLLTSLYQALNGPRGDDLTLSLRRKYRAALIDEFQDTDPVQFHIFDRLHGNDHLPLFLIGDPKQAIYSFRGADIFAYLKAASGVEPERRFTLTANWRSTPALLTALNGLFDNKRRPFLFREIASPPVVAGREDREDGLSRADGDQAPLQLWYLPPNGEGKPCPTGQATHRISRAVAAEIARLVRDGDSGRALVDGRPLLPEHLAVIVRSHRQAGFIQEALRALSIPSVMRSDASVFATREARQLCALLAALAAPGDEWKLRAALVTDIFGQVGDDIVRLLDDEQLWEEWLTRFRDYHRCWMERGFMVMAQTLMAREGVRGRLLRHPDGERRLTNLLHCFELLHAASQERSLGAEGLAGWFAERIAAGEASEASQIRLETDDRAVKILTVHVSKGLEYPVVFCPFLWGGVRSDGEILSFHDGYRPMKDYGSDEWERHRIQARMEALAENLRLAYVALTRAKYRCYLVGGSIADGTGRSGPETSPLAYLFHASPATRSAADPVGALAREVKQLSADEMEQQLLTLAEHHPGAISLSPMPEEAPAVPAPSSPAGAHSQLRARTFDTPLERDWRVSSFTSLASRDQVERELPDRDRTGGEAAPSAPSAPNTEEKSIFAFPRGARAGIVLHELFEKLDFAGIAAEKTDELVTTCLRKHGFGAEWREPVSAMVHNVVATRFSAPEGGFSLGDLKPHSWLTELEFFLPLGFVTPALLGECLTGRDDVQGRDLGVLARSLSFRPTRGMLRGFMDMVFRHGERFYLVDWKSNHLGNRVEAYNVEALKGAMEQNLYCLQYLLYTVALNRYLSLRVRDYSYTTHFGGVLYLFLRGMDSDRGEEFGVFRDIPPEGVIRDMTDRLIRSGG